MQSIDAFSGGLAFWWRGRGGTEEQPPRLRVALAVWAASAAVGWVVTVALVWASQFVAGG